MLAHVFFLLGIVVAGVAIYIALEAIAQIRQENDEINKWTEEEIHPTHG